MAPTDTIEVNIRQNWMDIDRTFGGANGGGLTVLNEGGQDSRITNLVGGHRFIDPTNTAPANVFDNDFNDGSLIEMFTNPTTGETLPTQRIRPGLDLRTGHYTCEYRLLRAGRSSSEVDSLGS